MSLVDIPYKRAHHERVNETEALEHIGTLIQVARMQLPKSQIAFSKTISLNVQTLRTMEKGERLVQSVAQAKVENGLGWRIGSIREVWEDRENLSSEQVTLEEMRRGAGEASFQDLENGSTGSPVMKASLLSDEELLAEISYRFRNYKVQLNGGS
jgi:DNA-binding XRE family transcriptional regulator